MPERNPREWQIRVCACGREQLQGELGAGVCWHHWDPDGEQFGLEMDRVYTVEDLGPERMLAWAIDRLGEEKVAAIVAEAISKTEWGEDEAVTVDDLVPSLAAVRALRGSGDGE